MDLFPIFLNQFLFKKAVYKLRSIAIHGQNILFSNCFCMKKLSMILLVDDDVDDQEVFCEVLKEINSSIECITAADCEEVLTMLQNNLPGLPDYIFLDLNMPRMNGKQCLKALKEHEVFKNIPVIIYSTSSSTKDKEETDDLGAAYFLTKPSSISGLRKEIEMAISR